MPKLFHVNDKGNTGVCSATQGKCPFGGTDSHYASREEAQHAYEQSQENDSAATATKIRTHPVTTQALNSSLSYDGPEPNWLKKMNKDSEKTFGTKHEIIDVIDTIEGTGPVAVVWTQNSDESNDFYIQLERGYEVSSLGYRDMKTGEVLGRVKAAYVTDASFERSFGDDDFTAYRLEQDRHNTNLLDRNYNEDPVKAKQRGLKEYVAPYDPAVNSPEEILAAKRKLWTKAHKAMGYTPQWFDTSQLTWGSAINLTEEHAPTDEKILDADLAVVTSSLKEKEAEFRKTYDTPAIDYSEVYGEHRGKGLGASMYVYMARKLGKDGLQLRASGIQSDSAQSMWKRLAAEPKMPISSVEAHGSQKLSLDFRENKD